MLSLLETTYQRSCDLRKKSLKTLSSTSLRYRSSFSENSNVPTSEGKVLMETYFKKTFHSYPSSLSNQGQNALKFNYVREPYLKSEIL
jgi:hypothetical protein